HPLRRTAAAEGSGPAGHRHLLPGRRPPRPPGPTPAEGRLPHGGSQPGWVRAALALGWPNLLRNPSTSPRSFVNRPLPGHIPGHFFCSFVLGFSFLSHQHFIISPVMFAWQQKEWKRDIVQFIPCRWIVFTVILFPSK